MNKFKRTINRNFNGKKRLLPFSTGNDVGVGVGIDNEEELDFPIFSDLFIDFSGKAQYITDQ